MPLHNPDCFNNHLGPWMIEPGFMSNALAMIKAGTWQLRMEMPKPKADDSDAFVYMGINIAYQRLGGVALIEMDGPLMKGWSKFGGTSTVHVRKALRAAMKDDKVNSILLMIDSPGGTVAGTEELAADIKMADSMKPTCAYCADLCASAAFWAASQTRRITANATAQIGSIGTVAVVEDSSKKAEMQGIKVHVVSTGEFKGAFTDGAPVTEAELDYLQTLINNINGHFLEGVAMGRKMNMKEVKAVADGRVFLASDAKKMGLIDAVDSLDSVISGMGDKYAPKPKQKTVTRAEMLDQMIKMENQD